MQICYLNEQRSESINKNFILDISIMKNKVPRAMKNSVGKWEELNSWRLVKADDILVHRTILFFYKNHVAIFL